MHQTTTPFLEYSVWEIDYIFPSKQSEPDDIQLTAMIIYELHKLPHGESIQEEVLVDSILNIVNISQEKIIKSLYTLHKQGIICMETIIYQNEPAYTINKFAFDLRKVNEEFKNPWHLI